MRIHHRIWAVLLTVAFGAGLASDAAGEPRSTADGPSKAEAEPPPKPLVPWAVYDIAQLQNPPRFYRLTSGPGYTVRNPARAWGTYLTITRLQDVMVAHHRRFPKAPPVVIQDISSYYGGKLEPHVSHQEGRDVDIPLIQGDTNRYQKTAPSQLNLERNWHLLDALINTGDVDIIFLDYALQAVLYEYAKGQGLSRAELTRIFQYPRGPERSIGIVRHEPGHDTHFHVRFRRERRSPHQVAVFVRP